MRISTGIGVSAQGSTSEIWSSPNAVAPDFQIGDLGGDRAVLGEIRAIPPECFAVDCRRESHLVLGHRSMDIPAYSGGAWGVYGEGTGTGGRLCGYLSGICTLRKVCESRGSA